MLVPRKPNGGRTDDYKDRSVAIDLTKDSFQFCAVGPERAILYNQGLSRTWLEPLLADCAVRIDASRVFSIELNWINPPFTRKNIQRR